jgi:RNase P/RNase MRP subunit p30
MKQRDSGLNEILCKLAKKNEIRIGIDLKGVIKLKGIEKAKVLSRIRQNIRLCKRVGTSYIIMHSINYRKQDIASFLSVLGASTGQIKVGR